MNVRQKIQLLVGLLSCLITVCFAVPLFGTALGEERNKSEAVSRAAEGNIVRLSETGKSAIKLEVRRFYEQAVERSISVPGKIEALPTMQYAQHAALSGKIIEISVKPGQFVHAGDILAIIQSPELNRLAADALQSKAQIQSDIAQQKVLLEDEVKQSKAKLDFAEANYKRDKMLFDHGLASQEEVQLALSDLGVAQSRHKAAIEKRDVTLKALNEKLAVTMDPLRKRLALLGVSQNEIIAMLASDKSIGTVPIRSTNEGLVTEIKATSGQSIDPTVLLVTVTDIRTVWATASAYEEDIAKVSVGQRVSVSVPPYPKTIFRGRITFVGTQMDSVSHTLPVRAEIDNPQLQLKPDMFARLDIETAGTRMAILVPQDAVVERSGESLVFVEKDGGYIPAKVDVGKVHGQDVEIVHGLRSGDRIVSRGTFALLAEWLKQQSGEGAFSRASGEGEVETKEGTEAPRTAASINPFIVALLVLGAFIAGVALTLLVVKGRKR